MIPRGLTFIASAVACSLLACSSGGSGGGFLADAGDGGGVSGTGGKDSGPGGTGGVGGAPSCPDGFTRCGDSCVNLAEDPLHCGTCETKCALGDVCANAFCLPIADCSQTPCVGLTYCDLATKKCLPGCLNDPQCGPNRGCDLATHTCGCAPGFHDCSGACASNTSPESCGSACTPCPTDSNGTATCNAGTCGLACNSGSLECAGGCASCPTTGVTSTTCQGSSCVAQSCSSGYKLCGGSCATCPSGTGVSSTACSGTNCIVDTCATGYHPCPTGCCPWNVQTITSVSSPRLDVAVDSAGTPYVAIGSAATRNIRLFKRVGGAWSDVVADTAPAALTEVTIAAVELKLTSSGSPRMLAGYQYRLPPSGTTYMEYAYVGASGTSFTREKIEGGFNNQPTGSLVLDTNGAPHAAYQKTACATRYARKTGASWQFEDVTASGICHFWSWIGVQGSTPKLGVYAYQTVNDAFFADKSTGTWVHTPVESSPDSVGTGPRMVIDASGVNTFIYGNTTTQRLRYSRGAPGAWSQGVLDPAASATWVGDLALDPLNRPHACYFDTATQNLKYARWTGTTWENQTIAVAGDVGTYADSRCGVAIDASGAPHVAFWDKTASTVVYAY